MRKLLFTLFSLCCLTNAQASIITDFAWVGGTETNTANTTLSNGIEVTLTSSLVQFLADPGSPNFASIHDAGPGNTVITLTFSDVIQDLRLFVSDIDAGSESLSNLSIIPTAVDSVYSISGNDVLPNGNNSNGNIYWTGLNATSVSFTYERLSGLGISLDEMEITTAVQVPATLGLFLILTGACLRRRMLQAA
ncbi:MAG: hypothetical protein HWE26_18970 [Alteromonadaceae bacterium]|nr:hypothetical protein [Alteromonadaceae bacterium]